MNLLGSINNSNYPMMSQSEWNNAPWNENPLPVRELDVSITITMNKKVKVPVTDYFIDEEGDENYSHCDLETAVKNNIKLPDSSWDILDFEVLEI